MNNANEVTIHLNNYLDDELIGFEYAYKQFLYPYSNANSFNIEYDHIIKRLDEVSQSSVNNVNIIGYDIFKYEKIVNLLQYLSLQPYRKTLSLKLLDIVDDHLQTLVDHLNDSFQLNLIIDSYAKSSEALHLIELLNKKGIKSEVTLIVSKEEHLDEIDIIINSITNKWNIQPFFTGQNLDFFLEHVYLKEEDLFEGVKSIETVYSNQSFNRNHFGKLTILSNGDIYTNINFKSVGNIKSDSLKKIVYDEMKNGEAWKKVRSSTTPCSECVYEHLCPPISNYEYVIGKYNLCNIN
jgi:pseudo-rSAM protein